MASGGCPGGGRGGKLLRRSGRRLSPHLLRIGQPRAVAGSHESDEPLLQCSERLEVTVPGTQRQSPQSSTVRPRVIPPDDDEYRRSEERRVGNKCGRPCRSRWTPTT